MVGLVVTLGILALIFNNWILRMEYIENQKIRMNGLICFKRQLDLYRNLVKWIEIGNDAIALAYSSIPLSGGTLTAAAKNAISIAKTAQNIKLNYTYFEVNNIKQCNSTQKIIFMSGIPYRVNFIRQFNRAGDFAILKERKWTYKLPVIYSNNYQELSFLLGAELKAQIFSTHLGIKTWELGLPTASLSWK